MNVIAFDAAYSLYPRATFDLRCGLSLAQISPREAKALAKYVTRGWAIHSTIWPHEEDTLEPIFKVYALRRMGDRDSWVIPLDTTNITLRSPFTLSSPPFKEDPAAFSSWKLDDHTLGQYRMAYHFLSSTILKYDYVNADRRFLEVMLPFFQKQGSLEHSKFRGLPKDEEAWTWLRESLIFYIYLFQLTMTLGGMLLFQASTRPTSSSLRKKADSFFITNSTIGWPPYMIYACQLGATS